MAHSPLPLVPGPKRKLTLPENVLLMHYGISDLRRAFNGYLAIEQFIRPAPVAKGQDDAPPLTINREHLCQLLETVYENMSSKLDYVENLAETTYAQINLKNGETS